jgi:hypothetical protein
MVGKTYDPIIVDMYKNNIGFYVHGDNSVPNFDA